MQRSDIEWCDFTWNPIDGCLAVSPGCDHCFARAIATRFAGTKAFPNGFEVTVQPQRLPEPLTLRTGSRIFVNSMSDVFIDAVEDAYIARIFAVMLAAPRHTFLILTKRHGRMRALLSDPGFAQQVLTLAVADYGLDPARAAEPWWPLPNLHLGVSVEDQPRARLRIIALLDTPAAIRWASVEPLIGPVDLRRLQVRDSRVDALTGDVAGAADGIVYAAAPAALDWVVVGGESGTGARPMHPHWARTLRDQCQSTHVPLFFKQWGAFAPEDLGAWTAQDGSPRGALSLIDPRGGRWNGMEALAPADAVRMRRVGKKRAGHVLDGQVWQQLPGGAGDCAAAPDASRSVGAGPAGAGRAVTAAAR